MKSNTIVIVGAGLAGSLLAIMLGKRGFNVNVFEKRPDMRKATISAGRSINLALSNRGLRALRKVGMDDYILREVMPMKGRLIHALDGSKNLQQYGGRESDFINSVSRGGLNKALMSEAEKFDNVKFHFNHRCNDIDYKSNTLHFQTDETKGEMEFDAIIGTDGAFSAVRKVMSEGVANRFDFSIKHIRHEYKELSIPPKDENDFYIEKDVLHIWPRSEFMMIALPNFDGSFTCTVFAPHDGDFALSNFDTKEKVKQLFEEQFATALPFMPTLEEDFFENPTSSLATIKCYPWHIGGQSLILGDAAHAVVPFYGQGMNASFEDCVVLDELIEQHGDNWDLIFPKFTEIRKKEGDAIGDLAEQNYFEMSTHVANPTFVKKRQIELKLEQLYPDFNSKYSMVTFRDDIPYSVAKEMGEKQDDYLMNICSVVDNIDELDLDDVITKIRSLWN